jgi:hypothetical protein
MGVADARLQSTARFRTAGYRASENQTTHLRNVQAAGLPSARDATGDGMGLNSGTLVGAQLFLIAIATQSNDFEL